MMSHRVGNNSLQQTQQKVFTPSAYTSAMNDQSKIQLLSASDCLLEYGHLLSNHERTEILSYQQVYFLGKENAKKARGAQLGVQNYER